MKKWILALIVIVLLISPAYALRVYDSECDKSGKATLTFEATSEDDVIATENITLKGTDGKIIYGTWARKDIKKSDSRDRQYVDFVTDEGVFNESKSYTINAYFNEDDQNKTISYTFDCPGLFFTCSLLDVKVLECYNDNNLFNAEFYVGGLDNQGYGKRIDIENGLHYSVKTTNNYVDVNGKSSKNGNLPENVEIVSKGNGLYSITYEFPSQNNVERFSVAYINDATNFECFKNETFLEKLSDTKICTEGKIVQEEVDETASAETLKDINIEEKEVQDNYNLILIVLAVAVILIVLFFLVKKRIKKYL